jgi:hypothetical protein
VSPDGAAGVVLMLAGAACGAGTLLAMRRFSDQSALKLAKNRIRAHLYELRLFGDDPVLTLRAQGRLLLWNLRYARLTFAPAAVVAIPAVLIASQLEALLGSSPLGPGDTATLTAQFAATVDSTPELVATQGFTVESPPVRIPELRQVCWRVRATGTSDGVLWLRAAGEETERFIHAGPGLRFVPSVCSSAPLARIRSGCALESTSVESITVEYPPREIALLGFQAHWLAWFALFWLAAMLLLRRRFRVTF